MQVLVILRLKPDVSGDALGPLIPSEAATVWEMHTTGVLRCAHYIEGPSGVVLMLETAGLEQAESHVRRLPMVAAGLLDVEILPLTPFTGYGALFARDRG